MAESLRAVATGLVAKEAVPEVLTAAARSGIPVRQAVSNLGIQAVGEQEVEAAVDSLLSRESAMVLEKGEGAFSALMGEAMKELRGKADGALVSRVLKQKLQDAIRG
jgi:glutamyl-tRNA(Gln) amidotransferase subunit E